MCRPFKEPQLWLRRRHKGRFVPGAVPSMGSCACRRHKVHPDRAGGKLSPQALCGREHISLSAAIDIRLFGSIAKAPWPSEASFSCHEDWSAIEASPGLPVPEARQILRTALNAHKGIHFIVFAMLTRNNTPSSCSPAMWRDRPHGSCLSRGSGPSRPTRGAKPPACRLEQCRRPDGRCRPAARFGRERKVRTPQGSVPDNVRDFSVKAERRPVQQKANRPRARKQAGVRVKGWGKSPPRWRQRQRHGKPHTEQDQIGRKAIAPLQARLRSGPLRHRRRETLPQGTSAGTCG